MLSLRLTGNFLFTWEGLEHQDWRYAELRSRLGFLAANFWYPSDSYYPCFSWLYTALLCAVLGSRELNIYDALALFTGIASAGWNISRMPNCIVLGSAN